MVRSFLETCVHDCRKFAGLARRARLDELHMKFGLSWEDFCAQQLDHPHTEVEAILLGVEALGEDIPIPAEMAKRVGYRLMKRGRPKKGQGKPDNIRINYGTDALYLTARLDRDHPEILDAYERGEYKSVRQAAIAAGLLKTRTRVERILRQLQQCTADERRRVAAWLAEGDG
jgi:hypothetical protein